MHNLILILLMLISLGSTLEPELDSIVMHDGYFYGVAKGQYEIVKLNKKGQVVARTGRRGRGPGEFSTDVLRITFVGDTLYVYDGIGKKTTLLNKDLKIIEEQTPKKIIHDVISYNNQLHIVELRLPKEKEGGDRSVRNAMKAFKKGDFVVRPYKEEKDILMSYRPKMMKVPVYPNHGISSNQYGIAVFYNYQNRFQVYKEDLNTFTIDAVEELALGQERKFKDPDLKYIYKEYPYNPVYYKLVKNVIWIDQQNMLIQIRSYKKGDKLLFYDTENQVFTRELSSPPGQLIGRDSSYHYFYEDRTIKKYTSEELQRCQDSEVTFYISSFKEQCHSCKDSFFEIYEWMRELNIPYRFVVKDLSWFGSVDEEDYRDVIASMYQWNVWGAVHFKDGCDGCFEEGINMKINEEEKLISLPASVSEIESKVSCE